MKTRKSSGDEIANVNFLPRHRTRTTAHNKLYSFADDRLQQRVISHLLYNIYAVSVYANCLPPKFRYSIFCNAFKYHNK